MGRVTINGEDHNYLNEIVADGFTHKFSGSAAILDNIATYAVDHNIEEFSQAALQMYNTLLPQELASQGKLNLNHERADLLFIEQFLVKKGMISKPTLEAYLKREEGNPRVSIVSYPPSNHNTY